MLGGPDAAEALAASLRSNSTLRTLDISGTIIGNGGKGLACIFGALSSGPAAAPSCCALTALDVSCAEGMFLAECAALGLALADP